MDEFVVGRRSVAAEDCWERNFLTVRQRTKLPKELVFKELAGRAPFVVQVNDLADTSGE